MAKVNMAVPESNPNTVQPGAENTQRNDKEYNFAQIRQQLERERTEKVALAQELEKVKRVVQEKLAPPEDDGDDEPYVDHKRLKRELGKVAERTANETDNKIQQAVNRALGDERQRQWLKNNPDFHEVMQHAQAFADHDPELAETILEMPEGFERQKLVYKNIKALGIHKPPEQKASIQDKIDQNRKSPFYQPTGVATPGFGASNGGKDYSPAEGQNAYKKMQELKSRLRI
jgi:hypothetical protein